MKTTLIILAILVVLFYAVLILWMRRNAKITYENDFIYLKSYIKIAQVNESNFYLIIEEFEKLVTNNQDPEKTSKLWDKFNEAYMGYRCENDEYLKIDSKIRKS
jgi:hypothetical protein